MMKTLRSWAAAAACGGMLASPVAMAAPTGHAAAVNDVALATGGVLTGQVVDAQGAPVAQAPVALLAEGRELIRVASAADGTFAISGLRGGIYEVAAAGQQNVYRAWTADTAPPAAGAGVMVVSGGEVVRGQYGYGPPPAPKTGIFHKTMGWVSNHPFITAGIVATAIAVPVAIAETDDAS
ncbi:MAG TPA: carboxypeptidase-like regulatory domain-containing protein [Lacipirellulaceae bacterium]|nr:carboxypeptidase-like regulatory domain-containing protein [Lacipirellulaceae bacterium]